MNFINGLRQIKTGNTNELVQLSDDAPIFNFKAWLTGAAMRIIMPWRVLMMELFIACFVLAVSAEEKPGRGVQMSSNIKNEAGNIESKIVASKTANEYPRILYDNDATCMDLPWKPTADFPAVDANMLGLTNQHFKKYISEVAGLGISVGYKFNPGLGRVPVWQKTSCTGYSVADHFAWYKSTYKPAKLPVIARYIEGGGDIVQTYLDEAASYPDLKPYLSLRMNDPHCIWDLDLEPGGTPDRSAHVIAITRFLYENYRKDYMKYFRRPDLKKDQWSGPEDYASSEVRDMRMRIIKDLICNYTHQGLELNFVRWTLNFKHSLPIPERKSIMTAFIREIREELYRSGKNRKLILKLPHTVDLCNQSGFDLPALNHIADMVVISPPYFNKDLFQSELDIIRKQLPNPGLFAEIHCFFDGTDDRPIRIRHCCTKSQLYETAGWAYDAGVDGISLFNFQYYRGGNNNPGHEPYFDVIPRLADKEWCLDYYRNAFKLDIGASNQKVQREWTGWSVAEQEQSLKRSFKNKLDKEFTIEISPARGFRGKGMTHNTGDLLEDGVVADGPLNVTIKGLSAGDYTLTTFHHDPDVDRGNVDIDLQDAKGTQKNIVKNLRQSTGSTPDPYAEALFNFHSDGKAVTITLHGNADCSGSVSLNGLVIIPRSRQPGGK